MSTEDPHQPLRPMRLLLVADSLNVGGAERHVVSLYNEAIELRLFAQWREHLRLSRNRQAC